MRIAQLPMPIPESGEILIEVKAAGVNAIDWFTANAFRKLPSFLRIFPYVPGKDVSGVVVEVGPNSGEWKEGDEAMGLTGFSFDLASLNSATIASGSYGTYTTLDASTSAKKPSNVSHVDAAGIPLAALTAWKALVDTAELKDGSKVLILGGAGGVGTLAIQLAKAHCKCDTVAVTCSESSSALVKSLGADLVIDYKKENFEQVLEGSDYDCVLDAIGYDDKCRRAAKVLKKGSGILVDLTGPPSLGHLRKGEQMDSFTQYLNSTSDDGPSVRYQLVGIEPNGPALRTIASYFESGEMKPVTDKVYVGLGSVQDAFDFNKSGGAHGKLVIDLQEPAPSE
ncbi:hypothetical protein BSKO_09759 [Bryopsis sp. KO-2023]|nr:hypothetical protein BSKO_09759 [Bryopsis sp. KO-2023]